MAIWIAFSLGGAAILAGIGYGVWRLILALFLWKLSG